MATCNVQTLICVGFTEVLYVYAIHSPTNICYTYVLQFPNELVFSNLGISQRDYYVSTLLERIYATKSYVHTLSTHLLRALLEIRYTYLISK